MEADAEKLIEEHYEFTCRFAARFSARLPPFVDRGQIQGAALEGLCRAAKTFDPSRGVPFKAWAMRRITGQIQDDLRSTDHLSRTQRSKVRRAMRAGDKEDIRFQVPVSLDAPQFGERNDVPYTRLDGLVDHEAEEEYHRAFPDFTSAQLHTLIDDLPPRERTVISLRFYEEMRLWQIALVLGVSESRVSQMEAKALHRMRANIQRRAA